MDRSQSMYIRRPLHITHPRFLTLETAQAEQLGASNLRRAHHLDFINDLGILREDTLHSLSEADFSHGEAPLDSAALGDHNAFERLVTFLLAFFNPYLHANRIPGPELGNILALHIGSNLLHDL